MQNRAARERAALKVRLAEALAATQGGGGSPQKAAKAVPGGAKGSGGTVVRAPLASRENAAT